VAGEPVMTGAAGVLVVELLDELDVLEELVELVDDVLPSLLQPASNTATITPEIISRCII
jgi:hypothetical protein